MCPRRDVTRERIEELLREIGSGFRHPCRLFLCGGDGIVWRGLRGFTRDVDIAYEIAPAHHDAWIQLLRGLKDRLEINIEEAHPGDFVPLPPESAKRAQSVGRYGQVEVFLLDPYAVAAGKLGRGHEQDLADIRTLLAAGVIDAASLRRHVEAIVPEYARRRVANDPTRLLRMLDEVLRPAE